MERRVIAVIAIVAASVISGSAIAQVAGNSGTGLSTTVDASVQCLATGGAATTLEGVLTTTGSTDSVEITLSVDGAAPAAAGLIAPEGFAHAGRIKTAPYSVPISLEAGAHAVRVCLTQSGADGRPSKAVCAETAVDVSCNVSGCSDGQREGFTDLATYPAIAACSGGWSVPGIMIDNPGVAPMCPYLPTYVTTSPACGRSAGDDSANPAGTGCNVSDLCAAGWHVCATSADVAAHSPTGCAGAIPAGSGPLFFATRQSSNGCGVAATGTRTDPDCNSATCTQGCAQTAFTSNDVFGCGNYGAGGVLDGAPLDYFSHNACSALGYPWTCDDRGPGLCEAYVVTKASADFGGVLCCRD